ncbi:receptor-like protein kinase [Musa troglodytarum]|uniref:non-specific serine/threonine protein kinase n=1 Tax=Musa troglodytarum TaxID=320322 RepID=A0A9E7EYU5_9LILI|nr:receptor-like protein kinase [Musa troglodytarum]
MKCFHFSSADAGGTFDDAGSRVSRLSWARSLSIASTSSLLGLEPRRAELDPGWDLPCPATSGPPEGLRAFAFSELKAATRGFGRSLLIGEGGFGCVYRGVVAVAGDDGAAETMDVAVKQLNRHGLQGHKEWVTEVNFLGVVKHPNLVKLVGYCAEDDERGIQRLLVYELMRNKSLEDHLLSRVSSALSWSLRLKIALDAARGLAYLHEEMDFQVVICCTPWLYVLRVWIVGNSFIDGIT